MVCHDVLNWLLSDFRDFLLHHVYVIKIGYSEDQRGLLSTRIMLSSHIFIKLPFIFIVLFFSYVSLYCSVFKLMFVCIFFFVVMLKWLEMESYLKDIKMELPQQQVCPLLTHTRYPLLVPQWRQWRHLGWSSGDLAPPVLLAGRNGTGFPVHLK